MERERLTVLVIDDNPDNLTVSRAVLADALPGARVLVAADGPTGLAVALAEDPDVIVLDVVMPGMDGFEVCRRLKEDERLRGIPVVFLTAVHADRASRVRALEVGAEGFLPKPMDEVEVVAEIRAMAKVKAANRLQQREKERLAELVVARTRELEAELAERRRTEALLQEQLAELRRWQAATLGREERVLELKREVNELLAAQGRPPRYESAAGGA